MANGHGGYRRPTNPAPVSGPGALSRRTDGRQPTRSLPNAKYGENAAFEAAQGAAPMSGDLGMSAGIVTDHAARVLDDGAVVITGLDETTATRDGKTISSPGRTTFVVAQRISTVLEDGSAK